MKLVRLILVLIVWSVHSNASATNDDSRFGWMNSTFDTITSIIPSCLEVPQFSGIHQSSASLDLDSSGKWIPVGTNVSEGKLLQIEWSTKGVLPRPSKYKVLYRVDPRFEKPQVFIQKYDYNQDKYISDFHHYKDGVLLRYQAVPEMTFQDRVKDYVDYFKFNGRLKIPVKKDDVINITLDSTGSYFGSKSEMNAELGSLDSLVVAYTQSSIPDNRIIYSNAQQFCADGIKTTRVVEYAENCVTPGLYWDLGTNTKTMQGRINNIAFDINKTNLVSCSESSNGKDNNPLCYYDKGRGMKFAVGGTTIKEVTEKFVNSSFTGKDFFYHKSDIDGDLEFNTSWLINGMVQGYSQFMEDWATILGYTEFLSNLNTVKPNQFMNFLHFGRYLMDIEIGNALATVSKADLDAIKVEYLIQESGVPSDSTSGTSAERIFRGNAGSTGFLWVRVVRPNDNLTGVVQVKIANYTGSTWFSDLVYGKLVKPLREKFNELSMIIYHKLITNATFQGIARAMLVLYIIIYGLVFLAGATQITVTDIVTRVLKIGVVFALFSETSWTFFSQNLFNVFIDGSDSLMTAVVGVTSQAGNVFGFIDPIFDKYTNGRIWGLLFIQLLQIHTGMTFFAIITIYAILIYFRAILEVIVSYCLAFLGLAVMVSLAPFFIVLILFERTKSMFDNWLSVMFSYMIQPTILLIFFLLIDQIMGDHIAKTVVRACWGILIPIKIGLDLNNMGIPLSFSFTLPFLPGIPFYVPQLGSIGNITDFFSKGGTLSVLATSSLLFFALSKLAAGLVSYTTLVVQYLTNVIAARQDGKLQQGLNPIKDITGDINKLASPITSIPSKIGKFVKEKAIDQKISHRGGGKSGGEVNYDNFARTKEESQELPTDQESKVSSDSSSTRTGKKSWISASPSSERNKSGITIGSKDSGKSDSELKSPSLSSARSKSSITIDSPDSGKSDSKLKSSSPSSVGRQGPSLTMGSSGFGMSDNSATLSKGSENISLGSRSQSEQSLERPLTPSEVLKQHVMDSGPKLDKPETMTQQSDSVERRDSIDESQVERAKEETTTESSNQDSVVSKVDNLDSSQSESKLSKDSDIAERKTSTKLQGGE
ncbi:MAG: type IV secretion system protein [Rickettsiaceae bacterium]|nr:type IV secretion system protein [Rickettsiaceae bacterium]